MSTQVSSREPTVFAYNKSYFRSKIVLVHLRGMNFYRSNERLTLCFGEFSSCALYMTHVLAMLILMHMYILMQPHACVRVCARDLAAKPTSIFMFDIHRHATTCLVQID